MEVNFVVWGAVSRVLVPARQRYDLFMLRAVEHGAGMSRAVNPAPLLFFFSGSDLQQTRRKMEKREFCVKECITFTYPRTRGRGMRANKAGKKRMLY